MPRNFTGHVTDIQFSSKSSLGMMLFYSHIDKSERDSDGLLSLILRHLLTQVFGNLIPNMLW